MLSSVIVAEQDSVPTRGDLLGSFRQNKRKVELDYVEVEMDCRSPVLDFLSGVSGLECTVPVD